jgi:hypothetical protein
VLMDLKEARKRKEKKKREKEKRKREEKYIPFFLAIALLTSSSEDRCDSP